ncbi:MAG TPA: trypsin-like peptidase domain-containing protein, partial [Patescibacteria group bacterium]|nr:trypsin-like peptidase domain-containing protein [Patescibacteria group bacterium]
MSGEDEVLNVIESVSKSVVHINTVRVVKDYYYRTMPLKGSGSGFILEPDGYIVTNAHVVRQADRIGVVLWDNKPVEGVILGICRSIDIAVVKIDSEGLPAARLGDSDKLRVGQRVYAIGNPFGLVG